MVRGEQGNIAQGTMSASTKGTCRAQATLALKDVPVHGPPAYRVAGRLIIATQAAVSAQPYATRAHHQCDREVKRPCYIRGVRDCSKMCCTRSVGMRCLR